MASIGLDRLSKIYSNGHPALRDFSLEVEDGELLVLVGPSGCGKSTLLRLLAGLEEPSGGLIQIGGRPVNAMPPQARNIAMVFQDYALYPTMTVRGNLEFPLKMRKLNRRERERRIAWAADLLGLTEFLDRRPRQLSGGQRQRVAMGRALVREPAVFLLDEPLSNLDAQLRGQVRAEIVELQRRTRTTMLYVTHDQVEAMTMGQRIAVLRDGELQQAGDPKTLYERPVNTFVAGFIGTPPMNLIPGALLLKAMRDGAVPRSLRLPSDLIAAVEAGARSLTAGLRPEAFSPPEPGQPGLPVRVAQVEYLGHETLVHVHFGEFDPGRSVWIVRFAGMRNYAPQEPLSLPVHWDGLLWFDEAGRLLEGDR